MPEQLHIHQRLGLGAGLVQDEADQGRDTKHQQHDGLRHIAAQLDHAIQQADDAYAYQQQTLPVQ
ncbi:hypothetical protein D3C81_1865990 [compost metagenome]